MRQAPQTNVQPFGAPSLSVADEAARMSRLDVDDVMALDAQFGEVMKSLRSTLSLS